MSKNKSFIAGTIVGGVVGTVAALLLAPKSGRELRTDLNEQYRQISDKTQEIAGTVSGKTRKIAEHTTEWAEKAKEVAVQVADEVKAWRASRKDASSDAVPEAEDAPETTDISN